MALWSFMASGVRMAVGITAVRGGLCQVPPAQLGDVGHFEKDCVLQLPCAMHNTSTTGLLLRSQGIIFPTPLTGGYRHQHKRASGRWRRAGSTFPREDQKGSWVSCKQVTQFWHLADLNLGVLQGFGLPPFPLHFFLSKCSHKEIISEQLTAHHTHFQLPGSVQLCPLLAKCHPTGKKPKEGTTAIHGQCMYHLDKRSSSSYVWLSCGFSLVSIKCQGSLIFIILPCTNHFILEPASLSGRRSVWQNGVYRVPDTVLMMSGLRERNEPKLRNSLPRCPVCSQPVT